MYSESTYSFGEALFDEWNTKVCMKRDEDDDDDDDCKEHQQAERAIASLRLVWPNTNAMLLSFISKFIWFFRTHWIFCWSKSADTYQLHFIHPFCQRHFGQQRTKMRSYVFSSSTLFPVLLLLLLFLQFNVPCVWGNIFCVAASFAQINEWMNK